MQQIDIDHVAPLPRWRFLLLRGSFWLLASLSVLFGSVAVGTILFLLVDFNGHGLWTIPHDVTEILMMVPFVWIIALVLFMASAEISLKQTRKGYRYPLRTIVLASIMLSIIFGSVLAVAGIGKTTHEVLSEFPLYNSVTHDSKDVWSRPHSGKLAGTVVSIQDNNDYSVRDFGGHLWRVRMATSTKSLSVPEIRSTVRMSGLLEPSSNLFIAQSVHEWEE